MNYIVLDLEWNQPVSYASAAYRKVGSKLLFEVIQIGAAKVDETMQIVADELDLDTDAVKSMYDFYDFSTEITDDDKEGFQKTADFMYESGMIDEAFDVKQLFIEK